MSKAAPRCDRQRVAFPSSERNCLDCHLPSRLRNGSYTAVGILQVEEKAVFPTEAPSVQVSLSHGNAAAGPALLPCPSSSRPTTNVNG